MTIGTAATPLSYNGDDVTTDFAITWKYFAKSDVVVTYRDAAGVETVWVLDTDYSLTAAGVDAGGTLTALVTTPATGGKLVITLEPPNTQSTSFPRGGIFPASNVEDALDIASQRDAKIESLLDRMLRVPITDALSGSNLEIPNETDRASKFLAFDASGIAIAASSSVNAAPTTAFTDTLLDDADADAFWTTLMATITKSTARSSLGVLENIIAATGDLIYGTAASTPDVLPISTEGKVLIAGPTVPKYGITLAGYLNGYTLSNGTDANHDIDFAAGTCVDSAGVVPIIGSASTKQADANWAAGSAAGGMPATVAKTGTIAGASTTITGTGTAFTTEFAVNDVLYSSSNAEYRRITAIASDTSLTIDSAFTSDPSGDTAQKNGLAPNTWYHCFAIATAAGASVDHGYDTQPDASNLLADATVSAASLTVYRRLGSVLTDSSGNILAFWQYENKFMWDVPIVDVNGSAAPTSDTALTVSTPYGVVVKAHIVVNIQPSAAPVTPSFAFYNSQQTTQSAGSSNNEVSEIASTGQRTGYTKHIYTDTASQVHYQGSHGYTHWVISRGYEDNRGMY